jgi:hypothetical protein
MPVTARGVSVCAQKENAAESAAMPGANVE